jgi:hypothetical protein
MAALVTPRERMFVAEVVGPPRLKLRISHTSIEKSSFGRADWLGWEFVACEIDPQGHERPLSDSWETTFLQILRYSSGFSDEPMRWRWQDTGEEADLRSLQPGYDASGYEERAFKVLYGPDRTTRACFNAYDDGACRFMLEREIRAGDLAAWEPVEWGVPQTSLEAAEADAQEKLGWPT